MNRHMQKAMALFLTLLMLLTGSFALAEDAAAPTEPEQAASAETTDESAETAEWTVLLYLCGTDLESRGSMATYNLQEIAKTTPSEQVNFLIETGGTKEWHAKDTVGLDISTEKLQRYIYNAEGYSLVDEQPLDNMASAATLTDFIQWGAKNYPAKKIALLLWDHGGGSASGLIVDELHNSAIMPLEQMEIAVDDAEVPLEAVILDTCLMAGLETAQALQHSAKYLVASEETVPGYGSAYAAWLQYLYNNPSCDGARFGKEVCDATQQKYAELGMTNASRQLTFSVIDLNKLDAVSAAFDQMFVEIGALLSDPEYFSAFGYYTQKAQHYAYSTMIDLADMASRAQNKAITNDTANAVIEAVNNAVVYSVKGDQRAYSRGLSFYYAPAASSAALDHYARSCKSAPYLAFLDAASMSWTAPAWVYEQTPRLKDISRKDYIITTKLNLTSEGLPLLTITNAKSAAVKVDTIFFQYDKASDEWLKLGTFDRIDGNFETGEFIAEFPGAWNVIDDSLCQMSVVEETVTHTLYNVPFRLIYSDEISLDLYFRMAYVYDVPLDESALEEEDEWDEEDEEDEEAEEDAEAAEETAPVDPYAGHYEFYGVWDNDSADSTALPSRNAKELSAYYGYQIQMVLNQATMPALEYAGQSFSKPFALTADIQMGLKTLPKGDYAMVFHVTDVFGNTQVTEPISISWDGKSAIYSGPEVLGADLASAEAAQ